MAYGVFDDRGNKKAEITHGQGVKIITQFNGEWIKLVSGKRAYELAESLVQESSTSRLYIYKGDFLVEY